MIHRNSNLYKNLHATQYDRCSSNFFKAKSIKKKKKKILWHAVLVTTCKRNNLIEWKQWSFSVVWIAHLVSQTRISAISARIARDTRRALRARLKFNSSTNPRLCGGSPAVIGCHLSLSSPALAGASRSVRARRVIRRERSPSVRTRSPEDRFADAYGLTNQKEEDSLG